MTRASIVARLALGLALPNCSECGRLIDEHSLEGARACSAELTKREPTYCRLTGLSHDQLELWREAQRRR